MRLRPALLLHSGSITFRAEGPDVGDVAAPVLQRGGQTLRMRDAKGLADLAVLLAAPGREVPAADLVAATGAGEAGRADLRLGADEVFDATARRELRARVADLASEIAEAES